MPFVLALLVCCLFASSACAAPRPAHAPRKRPAPPPHAPAVVHNKPAPPPDFPGSEAIFHYVRARLSLERGDWQQALSATTDALAFDESAVLYALRAQAYHQGGKTTEALESVDRGLKLDPNNVEALTVRADVLWTAQRRAEAEPALRSLLSRQPSVEHARRLMLLLVGRGDVAGATTVQKDLTARRADSEEAALQLAQVCLEAGHPDCVAREVERAAAAWPRSEAICGLRAQSLERQLKYAEAAAQWEHCVPLAASDAEPRAAQWRALSRAGRSAELRNEVKSALAQGLSPAELARLGDVLIEAQASEAAVMLGSGIPAQASAETHLVADFIQAYARSQRGECDLALKLLRPDLLAHAALGVRANALALGCRIRKNDAAGAVGLAQSLMSRPDPDGEWVELACRAFVLAHRPKDAARLAAHAPTPFISARCLHLAGDDAGALAKVEAPLRLQPDDPQALVAKSFVQWDAGQLDGAVATARLLVAVQPGEPEALNTLAYMLVRRGKSDAEALSLARKAHELHPESGEILDTYGVAELEAGKPSEALDHLRKAADWLPHDPEVLLHLGDALARNDKPDAARECWQRALRMLPLEPHVTRELQRRLGMP